MVPLLREHLLREQNFLCCCWIEWIFITVICQIFLLLNKVSFLSCFLKKIKKKLRKWCLKTDISREKNRNMIFWDGTGQPYLELPSEIIAHVSLIREILEPPATLFCQTQIHSQWWCHHKHFDLASDLYYPFSVKSHIYPSK